MGCRCPIIGISWIFFSLCMSSMLRDEIEFLCLILWRVWFCRNKWRNDSQLMASKDVIPWARSFLAEFRIANFMEEMVVKKRIRPPPSWVSPESGLFKMNINVAINSATGSFGLGIIVRD